MLTATLADCAAVAPQPSATQPDYPDYKARAVTRTEGQVRVSTSVFTAAESAALYGVSLAKRGIQPVWIEVRNPENQIYYLLSPGLDPNFFPASEAAEAMSPDSSSQQRATLDQRFRAVAFHHPIAPGKTTSGFVLTNLQQGVKLVPIDLVGSGRARTF
jgi:hypothetical protein